jgi:hypothetical protein
MKETVGHTARAFGVARVLTAVSIESSKATGKGGDGSAE